MDLIKILMLSFITVAWCLLICKIQLQEEKELFKNFDFLNTLITYGIFLNLGVSIGMLMCLTIL